MMAKLWLSFKVIVIGNRHVGKSALIVRVNEHRFLEHIPRADPEVTKTEIRTPDGKPHRFHLWNLVPSRERKIESRPVFYRDTDAVILVYDVVQRESFEALHTWVEDVSKHLPRGLLRFVIANKIDLETNRVVSFAEGKEAAESLGAVGYWEVSAKTGQNVDAVFQTIAERVITEFEDWSKLGTKK
jgi:small GTP-binding protein